MNDDATLQGDDSSPGPRSYRLREIVSLHLPIRTWKVSLALMVSS